MHLLAVTCCVCCRMPAHSRAVAIMYKDKHPRWWLQSFLAGVTTLVLGARNHTGQLLKVPGQ